MLKETGNDPEFLRAQELAPGLAAVRAQVNRIVASDTEVPRLGEHIRYGSAGTVRRSRSCITINRRVGFGEVSEIGRLRTPIAH
jgi:hypothetical protein